MEKYYLVAKTNGEKFISQRIFDCLQLPDGNWVICTKYKVGSQARIESDDNFKKCFEKKLTKSLI